MTLAQPTECLPEGWSYAYIERERTSGELASRWEIVDLKSEARYRFEKLPLLRGKCALAVAGLPLYTAAYMAWHVARAPLSAVHTFFQALKKCLSQPFSLTLLGRLLFDPPLQLVASIWSAVRAPFYMLKMEGAALYGIARPLEGRRACAAYERAWKREALPQNDVRRQGEEVRASFLALALCDRDFPHPFYFAYCFQPFGTLNDPAVRSVQFY